eukprot:1181082-Prorocentrum_minimum.AAC.3
MDAGISRPGPHQLSQFRHISMACPSAMYPNHRLPMSPNSIYEPHMHDTVPWLELGSPASRGCWDQ